MLEELEIKDFALVEHVRVPFSWGLNVLTGETGAGKSIIMDALNAVLGGKVGPSVIRAQAERAVVEATFKSTAKSTAWLKQQELADEETVEYFSISREVSKTGSKIRINGRLVNVALVQELRQILVTVHAQHEFRTLLSSQSQLEMLDALGDEKHRNLLAKVRTFYTRRKDLESQLKEMLISEEERARRLDFAQFQYSELKEAQIEDADEDEQLSNRRKALSNVTELEGLLLGSLGCLRGQDSDGAPGAVDLLQRALTELSKAAELDETLEATRQALSESLDQIEDQSRELRRYNDSLDSDPETLNAIDERLAVLASVKRKYGPSLSEAKNKYEQLSEEIERLENNQSAIVKLQQEMVAVDVELNGFAQELSGKRKTLAKKLGQRIQSELSELGMENCRFEIAVLSGGNETERESAPTVGSHGLDRVDFLMAPNPGQPLLPVTKIASGGELSRVMLAVKSIFAGADGVATVIFDEIDSGLSGRVLQSMRDKLARLANVHQILCVTHQPIIASVADNHVCVIKEQRKNSTHTQVSILAEPERIKALAEMASGQGDQKEALQFAKSLFDESSRLKSLKTFNQL